MHMTTLTKKEFEQGLDKRITPLTKILSQTTALLTHVLEDVSGLKTDMKTVKDTLESHTITLDAISKNTEISKAESAAIKARFDRHEQWIKQMAAKLDMKLES